MKNQLVRDMRVKLNLVDRYYFDVQDRDGNVLLNHNDDYFIYMSNVNLKDGKVIEGRYLGNLSPNSPLLDDNCKFADIRMDGFYVDGVKTKTARMVAVNNKANVIIVIASK